MKMRKKMGLCAVAFVAGGLIAGTGMSQQTTAPDPVSQTTATPTGTTVTKSDMKAQRKLEKQQEKAANANAKAAKAQAKAKKDQDNALQQQEKANGVAPKN